MTPLVLHVPSEPPGASQTFCGGPPVTSIFWSLPAETKPMKRLSGDQNGRPAPSVPSSARALSALSARIQIRFFPVESVALNARMRPSGEIRGASIVVISGGVGTSNRTSVRARGRAPDEPDREAGGDESRRRREAPREALSALAAVGDRRGQTDLRAALRDPLELELHVVRGLEAVLGILRETRRDQAVERRRRHRHDRRRGRRAVLQDRADQARLALAVERLLPRRHLVEDRAEREDVAPRVGLAALELLGRHVLERPEDRPLLREVLRRGHRRQGRRAGAVRGRREDLRETEIQQLRAALREHDVPRLEVPVHDTLPVRLVERVGDLHPDRQELVQSHRPLREAGHERLALDELHDEDMPPPLCFFEGMDGGDPRMVQARQRARLALEARFPLFTF